jgi:quercetin dioxygenase-like cupin family protein
MENNQMKYTTLYIDNQNISHFKEDTIQFQSTNFAPPAPPAGLSNYTAASQLIFFQIPQGWFGDWHPAPKKQYFCCLKGAIEITAGDGEKRTFQTGDVFLLEDTQGKGHTTRVIGNEAFVAAIVQVAT